MVETVELTEEQVAARRKRSVAMAWCLGALVVAFFVGTMTKIQTAGPTSIPPRTSGTAISDG
jgi:hypothetical protein